jgi:hypothetical protein
MTPYGTAIIFDVLVMPALTPLTSQSVKEELQA